MTSQVLSKALWQRVCRWLAVACGPLACIAWSKKQVLPVVTCLWFSLALLVTAAAGSAAHDWLRPPHPDSNRPPAGLMQRLWLGQYVLLALAIIATPLVALVHELTGATLSLRITLPLLVSGVVLGRRDWKLHARNALLPGLPSNSVTLAVLIALAFARAVSLHSGSAGAIGHDPLQHMYWAQHIFDYGFVPLTARSTDFIDGYPKFFHLLSACWAAAGQAFTVGPFVKLMPFMQAALSCGVACELLCAARSEGKQGKQTLLAAAMGLFLCWHLLTGEGQSVYPSPDLAGTPRFAAQWLLFALPLLVMAHRVGTIDASRIIWPAPFVLGALALGTNPVLLLLFVTYSLPFSAIAWLCSKSAYPAAKSPVLRSVSVGLLFAAACVALNPFAVQHLGRIDVVARVLGRMGVRLHAAGLQLDSDVVPSSTLCAGDWGLCMRSLLETTLVNGAQEQWRAATDAWLTLLGPARFPRAYGYALFAPLVSLVLVASVARGRIEIPNARARLFPALLLAALVPALLHPFVVATLRSAATTSYMWWLLWQYFAPLQQYVAPWLVCVLPMAGWLTAPGLEVPPLVGSFVRGTCFVGAVVCLSLFRLPSLTSSHYLQAGFKVDWPRLRAIQHINELVPPHETVLIPARHRLINQREHVLFTDHATGTAVPHLTTRMLFGANLGSGVDYGWPDLLHRFCPNPESRHALLRETNVRWVLVRDKRARHLSVMSSKLWGCSVTLNDLGAEYPPAWSEADFALYRVNP